VNSHTLQCSLFIGSEVRKAYIIVKITVASNIFYTVTVALFSLCRARGAEYCN